LISLAYVDQMNIGKKNFSHSLRFGKDLLEPRGERARNGDGLVW
jgi:hypothetical protein